MKREEETDENGRRCDETGRSVSLFLGLNTYRPSRHKSSWVVAAPRKGALPLHSDYFTTKSISGDVGFRLGGQDENMPFRRESTHNIFSLILSNATIVDFNDLSLFCSTSGPMVLFIAFTWQCLQSFMTQRI